MPGNETSYGLLYTHFFLPFLPSGRLDPRTVLMIVALTLTGTVCIGFMFFGWLSHLLPRLRIKMGKVRSAPRN